ncbi:MAG: LemA family protein [Spirochaetales bacterium]|nr:LemA family protein [Leptospiraceae bacterium]MCP5479853.1 LemA family protein [Spirochaetales bacterium]MCP5486243.1 LemA family protein [Spirochaetales bacterium]
MIRKSLAFCGVLLLAGALPGCGYNDIQRNDEAVNAAWSEVLNQYQRRYDLIPNLVEVVRAYAAHERETLEAVTSARARVGSIQATPELINNPQAFAAFQQSQAQMSSALSRLMLIVENYPDLKANENFRDLQAQLEGTENRIAVARRRFIQAVEQYNVSIRTFPNVITARIFGFARKENFQPENQEQISQPPQVNFN